MKPLLLLVLTVVMAGTQPAHAQDDPFLPRVQAAGLSQVAANCLEILAKPDPEVPAHVERMDDSLICYRGTINEDGVSRFLAITETLTAGSPLTVMMRSNGGSVKDALDAAEGLKRFDVTFVAALICASSCANYFFLPAQRRIVLANSMVAFKGGMSPGLAQIVERQLTDERRKRQPDEQRIGKLEKDIADLPALTTRQNDLLERAGIRRTFFNAFDEINALPRRRWSPDCAKQRKASMLVMSEDTLASQGARIDISLGPTNASELASLLDQVGGKGSVCWWDSPWPAGAD